MGPKRGGREKLRLRETDSHRQRNERVRISAAQANGKTTPRASRWVNPPWIRRSLSPVTQGWSALV
ncbi:hypothetical protein BSU04_21965 [Caballeronia sordidicola]|uniref:Uncharacterized protein n=1 Tax=Caballeronia sordidicola TaxID=196367 RepID=A0A226WYS6_CABSO|nr:hypothetical protein BSU04_21965 [Caballeronia sordidicola]